MPLKILLANAPNPDSEKYASNDACYPHIGILQLATAAADTYGAAVEFKVIDGSISDTSSVCEAVRAFGPDLVGIAALTLTYSEALVIAETAKDCGATVVMGDDHSGFFPELILSNRPYIDCVVDNDMGEIPFLQLVGALLGNEPLGKVSSLVYRQGGMIVRNPSPKYRLRDRNTIPRLDFIEDTLHVYTGRYRELFGHLHSHPVHPLTINNARGCENGNFRCTYCSIADLVVNTGNPEVFWQAARNYHAQWGINLFFEVYDSFTASPRYVDGLLEAMPQDMRKKTEVGDIQLMVYARALGLTKRNNVEKLKRLGVTRVNIGLDAADPEMLEAQRKNKTTEQTNLQAIRLISRAGMSVHGSYIAGAPGETDASLGNTVAGVRRMLEEVQMSSLEFSRFIPMPNAPAWDLLVGYHSPKFFKDSRAIDSYLAALDIEISPSRHRELAQKYARKDLLVIDEMTADWFSTFTHITEESALEKINEVDSIITGYHVQTGKNLG